MRAPDAVRRLSASEVHAIVDALSASIDALNQLVELVRTETGPLPIGVPTSVGTMRALIGYARSKLLQATIGELQIECPEAAQ
jgi:hypothetical protein